MLGGGGGQGVPGLLSVQAHFCRGGGGGRGSKRSAPLFPGPQGEPAHGLHPRFVVAEIWADRVKKGGGGVTHTACPNQGHGKRCCQLLSIDKRVKQSKMSIERERERERERGREIFMYSCGD